MKKSILCGLAAIVLCIGSLICGAAAKAEAVDTIYDGVHIDGIDVSGMTKAEAEAAFEEYVEQLNNAMVSFTANGKSYDIVFSDAGLDFDGSDVVETAYAYGRTGNLLARYKEITQVKTEPVNISIAKTLDEDAMEEQLKELTEDIVVEAKNASIERSNGSFRIIDEEIGQDVDYEASLKKLYDLMEDGWQGDNLTVELEMKETEPEYTAADFEKVKDVLGTYSTNYTGTKNREKNLMNGCDKINGTVVYPGEVFSVYEATSPFTTDNGYYAANQYLNGEVVTGVGGGICQVSTTLYNAVLRAELQVEERSPHSMVVSYVPKSADAAIAGTYKDFKFKNDTDAPIYIEASAGGGTVKFTIYGEETRPSNRTIEFESKILSTTQPGAEIETVDKSKPAGYRQVTQAAHVGYSAELWKYVYEDGKLVESIKVNSSKYMASPARVTVGPEKDDTDDETDSTTAAGKKKKKTTEETTEKKSKKTENTTEASDDE